MLPFHSCVYKLKSTLCFLEFIITIDVSNVISVKQPANVGYMLFNHVYIDFGTFACTHEVAVISCKLTCTVFLFCLCYRCVLFPVARDSIPGVVTLPVSLVDRTANIEKACNFLKEKGVNLPPDIVKGAFCGHAEVFLLQ